MSPLAQQILKQKILPPHKRTFKDGGCIIPLMTDLHCFDVTEVFGLASDLAYEIYNNANERQTLLLMDSQTFLPAPNTWIEWKRSGCREGLLLVEDGTSGSTKNLRFARSHWAFSGEGMFLSAEEAGYLPMTGRPLDCSGPWPSVRCLPGETDAQRKGWVFLVYALLALINTPRLIGRKQHMPHVGLERSLVRAKSSVGMFPLRAWTELTLSVSAMMAKADGVIHEAHLTGDRCRHFCRAHLRVRNGQLQQVRAHWRGNAALGIKQTRYKLVE